MSEKKSIFTPFPKSKSVDDLRQAFFVCLKSAEYPWHKEICQYRYIEVLEQRLNEQVKIKR